MFDQRMQHGAGMRRVGDDHRTVWHIAGCKCERIAALDVPPSRFDVEGTDALTAGGDQPVDQRALAGTRFDEVKAVGQVREQWRHSNIWRVVAIAGDAIEARSLAHAESCSVED